MRILLGISILVLVAILWTGISILRHIRLTRRRNAFLRDQQNSSQIQAVPLRAISSLTPLPARFAAPSIPIAHDVEEDADVAYVESLVSSAPKPAPKPVVVAPLHTDPEPIRPIKFPAIRPITAEVQPQPTILAQLAPAPVELPQIVAPVEPVQIPRVAAMRPEPAPLRIMEFVPEPAVRDIFPSAPVFPSLASISAAVPPPPAVAAPPPMASNQRRPVRSVHSQSSVRPAHRPDWIYFNKDMGDLSDPAPSRIRVRSR